MISRTIKYALCFALTTLVAASAFSQQTFDELSALSRLNRRVAGLRSMNDGVHYTSLSQGNIVRYSYADEGVEEVIYKGVRGSYDFSAQENLIILASGFRPIYRHSALANYKVIRAADGEVVAQLNDIRDFSLAADEQTYAFAKGNNLYVGRIGSEPRAITSDGEWNKVINGTADWVYEEEYGFTQAYAFSPDATKIAYLRFDESEVPTFEMMLFGGTLYNKAYSFKYPKAGDKNSVVTLHIYDIASGTTHQVATGSESDQYLPHIGWTPAGKLYFYRVNRKQNHFEVILCEGDGTQRVIYDEQDERYVERPSEANIQFIDADRFIVLNETATGRNHIYLYSVDKGFERALTAGEWDVVQIVEVTDKKVYYISTEASPIERNLYAINLKGKGKECLTPERGTHTISPSRGMHYYISTYSTATTPNRVQICNSKGEVVRTLVESKVLEEKMTTLPQKEFFTFTTERGDELNAFIIKPTDFDATKRYPVLLTQYSGPGSQEVQNRFGLSWEYVLANHGYIVVCCDGRGTGYMGEEFKKQTYGNLGALEVEDQLSFARYMAQQEWVDASRIGIYGWSYGGFMALGCALKGDGLFKMAIAVAPVTSWRYYDSIYTEIYNDLPQDNPAGYDDNSPINFAERLSDKTRLIIIHGTADDNVHIQNTMEMAAALNRAGKQYDMMIYPDQNHSMYPDDAANIRRKMIEYTLENL